MNALANETSPYLLQHAHNPVQWYPWGKEALEKAQKEHKPIIVSIGYSACHWCHVMERESFENTEVADLMNEYFVCIKVDREERPDVDAIYMDALQAMGLRGGWPLNVFLMPDQRPFYGGTYFPILQWKQLLENIGQAFTSHYEELSNSANEFAQNISISEIQKYGLLPNQATNTLEELHTMYQNLSKDFDKIHGGMAKAPKFPMPSIWRFLLQYAYIAKNQEAKEHLEITLQKIAFGGIYDQIGGGFARYSVDGEWFCPHFEKMLYDNAQLLTLYSEAYSFTKNPIYKEVAYEIIEFVKRELKSSEGGFYSALDADSEGEEGKFYIWKKRHLEEILGEDTELFCKYYNITNTGNWEFGNNILYKNQTDENFAQENNISINILKEKVHAWKNTLLSYREKRVHPGLDDKILTGWNGLMLKGIVDAYKVFGEKEFLDLAEENVSFLMSNMTSSQGFLWRTYKNGTAKIQAYLEDYASVIEGLLALYQVSFKSKYYEFARDLIEYTIKNFYDEKEEMFFFTDENSEGLIARKKEIFDNVISSSNSIMAQNLYFAGILFDNEQYKHIANQMLSRLKRVLSIQVEYATNWAWLYAHSLIPTTEIVIVGEDLELFRKELEQYFYPNKILVGSKNESSALPILEHRTAINGKTTLYVCFDKTCQLPTFNVKDTMKQLNF
ncbi:thioredoxin [bacterium 336/3]|nr:thioredoxin [bacterium 336/3]